MANVNTRVYGSETDWQTVRADSCKVRLATFVSDTYKSPYNHTLGIGKKLKLLSDDIDLSICPIAVDKNSSMVNCTYAGFPSKSDTVFREFETVAKQSALMYCSVPDNTSHNWTNGAYYLYTQDGNNAQWSSTNTADYQGITDFPTVLTSLTQPIVDWNYKKIAFCIFVIASDNIDTLTGGARIRLFDLNTYVNHAHTTYPYVLSVVASPKYVNGNYFTNFGFNYIYNVSETTDWCSFGAIPVESCMFRTDDKQVKYIYHNHLNLSAYNAQIWDDATNTYKSYTSAISGSVVVIGGYKNEYANLINNYNSYIQVVGNDLFKAKSDSTNKMRLFAYYEVTDANVTDFNEWCKKQCAYLGMFFTDDYTTFQTFSNDWYTAETTYLGIIDNNGVTHGEYAQGEAIKDYPQSQWENIKDDSPYDPTKKDDNKERPSTPYNYNKTLAIGLDSGNYYAMSKAELTAFKNWQNTVVNPAGPLVVGTPEEGEYSYEQLAYNIQFKFNGVYPEGQILSLMYYPFLVDVEMREYSTLIPDSYIKLGNYETTGTDNWYGSKLIPAKATKIDSGSNFVEMESGEYRIDEYFGDFRDYPPYTTMSLLIPYHGTIDLDAGTWYGHNINTRMVVDMITGASTTVIERDGIPVDTIQGQVGVPVNLIARNVGDFASTLISNSQSLNQQKFDNVKLGVKAVSTTASAIGKSVEGVMTKDFGKLGSAVGDIVSMGADVLSAREKYKNTQFQIEHNKADSTVISANTPSVAQYMEQFPRLIIRYPVLLDGFDPVTYGKTVGYACNIQGNIGSFKGYTVFSGADLTGLTCPEDIKTRLYGKLQQGIIL